MQTASEIRRKTIEDCIAVASKSSGARSRAVAALNKMLANENEAPSISPFGGEIIRKNYQFSDQALVEQFLSNRKDIQEMLIAVMPWRTHRFGDAAFVLRVSDDVLYAVAETGDAVGAALNVARFWQDMANVAMKIGWPANLCFTWELALRRL